MTEQRYCVKNKTTTVGDAITVDIIDCECDECAYTTGCKCGAYEGHFQPGPPPASCMQGSGATSCKLPNMSLACDTINGQRYLTEQFVCGDGSATSRHGGPTYKSCPFICLTKEQVQFFEPTFDGDCVAEDCCGNWRMKASISAETGLVTQCRAPPVGSGNPIPRSDVFAIGLPQPEPCRAVCGNTSTKCTDFHATETCGNYVTGPGFKYVELPDNTQPGCTQPLPTGTACENNVVYDVYPNGRCIRGCELMVNGHCMSTVTEQHPDIPKDYTYTQSARFNSTFWDAVTKNETFVVNITYGNLCGPNEVCQVHTVGSTTCQPLTCCNTCGEKSKEYLSSKKIQPWICAHVKAPCQFYWEEGPGSTYPPLSCEDSVLNSTVVDREQMMGTQCNGACNSSLGDSCAEEGLCVQHGANGERSRCEMLEPYPFVYVATLQTVANALEYDMTRWMMVDGEPRGFVCTWGDNNEVFIVPYPFPSDPLFAAASSSFIASFVNSRTLVQHGRVVFDNSYYNNIVQNINVTLTQTTNSVENGAGGSGSMCMPPAFTCESHSITFGFSNAVVPPQQYAFAVNGSVPTNISDCTLCFVGADFVVGECASEPTAAIHVNITAVSSGGCSAVPPCDVNNCAYQCVHEDGVAAYKGSLQSCEASAPVCQGLDGDLGITYPCLLTPKQNNWAFNNRASSCSVGLWGSVTCEDANAIPSLDGAYCICKGGYELTNGVCTACGVRQNSNPGGVCAYVHPTGEIAGLQLQQNVAHYHGSPRISGVTVKGGTTANSLNLTYANELFQAVKDNAHSPKLFMNQNNAGRAMAIVCSVDLDKQEICGDQLLSGFSGGYKTYLNTNAVMGGTNIGYARGASGGCSGGPYALYCITPSSIQVCAVGSNITGYPIPCDGDYQYIVLTDMVSVHNTPGLGCDYVIVRVDWDGSKAMAAFLVAYSCYGDAWGVGEQLVSNTGDWSLDLVVSAITDEQPVFTPIDG